jgi:hypothetical protein
MAVISLYLVCSPPIHGQVRLEIFPALELGAVDGRDVHTVISGNDAIAGNRLTGTCDLALAAGVLIIR